MKTYVCPKCGKVLHGKTDSVYLGCGDVLCEPVIESTLYQGFLQTSANKKFYGWNWNGFAGSTECLASNHRDLMKLDFVLKLFDRRLVAYQAGGNLGIFPKRLAQEFESVYTFEPDPENFLALCRNAPEKNILKFQAALGSIPIHTGISRHSTTHTHEGTRHVEGNGNIPVVRLDDFPTPFCDLLYLDVEGFEYFAILGAECLLKKHKPLVVCEANACMDRYGVAAEMLDDLMKSFAYRKVFVLYTDNVYIHESKLDIPRYENLCSLLGDINQSYMIV